ncbi:MAG: VRR-NUC domain-containing protein [Halomonas sp.]|nr:VRR-NUC domain-containing protein [Halomonas sp.]
MIANSRDDPFYYLSNFQAVLSWIDARYADLLSPEERDFVATFPTLPQAARALLVRMVMRKGTLFRASRLRYAEIGDCRAATRPLVELGWLVADPELDLPALFGLLTKAEVTATFRTWLPQAGLRKAELLDALQATFVETRPFSRWCQASDDDVYALPAMALYDRLRLMFFGNLHQDWSEFVLADLGVYRYESVDFSSDSRAFRCRDDIDTYLHLHACRERFEAGEAMETLLSDIPGPLEANSWLESRRAKLLYRIAQACERSADLHRALHLYSQCAYPGARARRLRVLERLERYEAALELARAARQAPESEAESQQIERLLPRLHRRLGLPRPQREPATEVERLELTLDRTTYPGSVEQAVRVHLETQDAPVHYVENTLITALFGLLCWEAIFAPLPGAFFHPFHSGPADMLQPDFHRRRAGLFETCLAQLESAAYKDTIRRTYHAKQGIVSPFVHWGALDERLLEQALDCLPARHLRLWFERLLEDIRAHRAGMPDLIQFWPDRDEAAGRYRMIEVKGPGDRLQDNQRRWLAFCARHGMPVAVCYVQWQGAEVTAESGMIQGE